MGVKKRGRESVFGCVLSEKSKKEEYISRGKERDIKRKKERERVNTRELEDDKEEFSSTKTSGTATKSESKHYTLLTLEIRSF